MQGGVLLTQSAADVDALFAQQADDKDDGDRYADRDKVADINSEGGKSSLP